MAEEGFEPSEAMPPDLQSGPVVHLGTRPVWTDRLTTHSLRSPAGGYCSRNGEEHQAGALDFRRSPVDDAGKPILNMRGWIISETAIHMAADGI